ncbi:glycoside hydrolase family 16 protein [Boletus coccyginus]|nr:glycoside hydrolase family 16 protein [Boletus coccyginus]
MGLLTNSLILLAAVHHASSATYSKSSCLTGQNFIDAFTWETKPDPNWGRVNYVDLTTAQSKGLVTLRADSTTILNSTGPGRDSFDLMSRNQYTTHVAMHVLSPVFFDIVHMPEGCGTWPAVCTLPAHFLGEIDIVEGVNNQSPDTITLHTSANCTMPPLRAMSGTSQGNNCDVSETENTSCGVTVNSPNSFGPSFNSAGGGWYAIERTSSFIKVFFWSRHSINVPKDISSPGSTIHTDNWGIPAAYFPSSANCNFATHLSPFNIVIDLDFCGPWAGNAQTYSKSGCPSTCTDFVNSNPSAFQNAYFTFNALTIYE